MEPAAAQVPTLAAVARGLQPTRRGLGDRRVPGIQLTSAAASTTRLRQPQRAVRPRARAGPVWPLPGRQARRGWREADWVGAGGPRLPREAGPAGRRPAVEAQVPAGIRARLWMTPPERQQPPVPPQLQQAGLAQCATAQDRRHSAGLISSTAVSVVLRA